MVKPVSFKGFQKGFQGVSLRGFRFFSGNLPGIRLQGVIEFNMRKGFYNLGILLSMTKGNTISGLLQGSECRMSLRSSCSIHLIHVE